MPTINLTETRIPSCYVKTGIPDGHLNMRSEPNEYAEIITVLAEGQMLYPIGRLQDGWIAVTTMTGEIVGFVNAKYTTYKEPKP